MDERRIDLSKYRQAQAEESFKAAEYCFEKKLYRDSLNRSYYAAFYAVKAVIALEGVDFKRHKDAIAYFYQNYVKDGPMSRDLGRKLGRLKQYREEGDYGDFNIVSEEEAKEQLEAASEIIGAIRNYLKKEQMLDENSLNL
ncbi:MAG: HEPN domain-containing protein [Lachnospiraceae bacterium]|nr:HEPN domain-containing protein [Lachnospiraceae bacterium]